MLLIADLLDRQQPRPRELFQLPLDRPDADPGEADDLVEIIAFFRSSEQ
jgi:hypothetical protein